MVVPEFENHLIKFEALTSFTGDNPVFAKQLVAALIIELENFLTAIKETLGEEEFLRFRKANHSIGPSLQMLEMNALISAIADYKNAYPENSKEIAENAKKITLLIHQALEEAGKWIQEQ